MVKIEGDKAQQIERREEQTSAKSDRKEDKKDFKKLLEKKKGKQKKAAAKKGDARAGAESAGKSLGEKGGLSRRGGAFGERLKDGRQQLGEQGERRARVDTERHTNRQFEEKRLDNKRSERHWQDVDKGEAKKHERHAKSRRGQAGKAPGKSQQQRSGPRGADKQGPQAADAPIGKLAGHGAAQGAAKADGAAPTQRSEMREQVAQLAQKLVEKAHVGQDTAGRRIMLLDLQVPGRGNVRVRLRRRGDGFELRMRPENEELARDLRQEREHFRQTASENGVEFSSIEIV